MENNNLHRKQNAHKMSLLILFTGASLNLALVTSEATPHCQRLLTSLTCPANQKLEQFQDSLHNINIHVQNITDELHIRENGSELLPNLQKLQSDLLNLTESLNRTWGVNEDFKDILSSIVSPQIDIKTERVEAFQVALVCLWLELQSLTKNVTSLTESQSSGQLTTKLRLSEFSNKISFVQQHMASANENITEALTRIAMMEQEVTSLQEVMNKLGTGRGAASNLQNHTGSILNDKLSELKSKLSKSTEKLQDSQSTLTGKHFNAIPQFGGKQDGGVSREILGMLEMTDAHLVNVTMATVMMEHELASLRLMTEQRLSKMEDQIKEIQIQQGASRHEETGEKPRASAITAETCNGWRRHLVGTSCYYIPLVAETDVSSTWWDARYLCKRPEVLGPGADLVAIETAKEMEDLTQLIDNHFGEIEEFWIGGNDLSKEGEWHWALTSERVGYANWGRSPLHSLRQNCMSMLRGLKWAAEPCFYRRRPICELKLP